MNCGDPVPGGYFFLLSLSKDVLLIITVIIILTMSDEPYADEEFESKK